MMKLGTTGVGVLSALALMLGGCENNAVSYSIEGSQHALILVREQPYFWSSEVNQFIVVSRLPQCQRRYPYAPGRSGKLEVSVYVAGDRLWALEQGGEWFLAGTEKCLLQPWENASGEAPGDYVGSFEWQSGVPVFVPASPEDAKPR